MDNEAGKILELEDQFNAFLAAVEEAGFEWEFTTCCCGEGLSIITRSGKREVFF